MYSDCCFDSIACYSNRTYLVFGGKYCLLAPAITAANYPYCTEISFFRGSSSAVISDPQQRATPELFKDAVLPFPNLFLTVMVEMVWISHSPESGPFQGDDKFPYNKYFLTLQSPKALVCLPPIMSIHLVLSTF